MMRVEQLQEYFLKGRLLEAMSSDELGELRRIAASLSEGHSV